MEEAAPRVFDWQPCVEAQGENRYAVRVVRFGDGYSQVVPMGLNSVTQSWQLSFRGSASEIREIAHFLDETKGCEAFRWQPPLRNVGLFRIDAGRGVSMRAHGCDLHTLEVTFQEVFEP